MVASFGLTRPLRAGLNIGAVLRTADAPIHEQLPGLCRLESEKLCSMYHGSAVLGPRKLQALLSALRLRFRPHWSYSVKGASAVRMDRANS
jgi:hypothetical protein